MHFLWMRSKLNVVVINCKVYSCKRKTTSQTNKSVKQHPFNIPPSNGYQGHVFHHSLWALFATHFYTPTKMSSSHIVTTILIIVIICTIITTIIIIIITIIIIIIITIIIIIIMILVHCLYIWTSILQHRNPDLQRLLPQTFNFLPLLFSSSSCRRILSLARRPTKEIQTSFFSLLSCRICIASTSASFSLSCCTW